MKYLFMAFKRTSGFRNRVALALLHYLVASHGTLEKARERKQVSREKPPVVFLCSPFNAKMPSSSDKAAATVASGLMS